MSSAFIEFVLEEASLAWLHGAGRRIRKRVEIALSEPTASRDDYGHVVLPP